MPLMGGPSDKVGNRYELLWTALCLTDILIGRANKIRIEPPNENGIEFRLWKSGKTEVHQVKRGYSKESRWRLSSLTPVLKTFREYLRRDKETICIFVSGHAAHNIAEIAERAKDSESLEEYLSIFLAAKELRSCFDELCILWHVEHEIAWTYLKRVRFETISELQLAERLDLFLNSVYSSSGEVTRAVLCQFALESIHKTLTAEILTEHLASLSIYHRKLTPSSPEPELLLPPIVSQLFGRSKLLKKCKASIMNGGTLLLGGPSGIGKTAIASRLCNLWSNGSVLWIDCQTFSSFQEILFIVDSFARSKVEDNSIQQALLAPKIHASFAGRLFGRFLDRHNILIVWDGYDVNTDLSDFLEAVHLSKGRGAQIITEQLHSENWSLPGAVLEQVPPLTPEETTKMFMELTSQRPNTELVNITLGHPYLIQLAASALQTINISDVATLMGDRNLNWIESSLLASLTHDQLSVLNRCAIFRIGFSLDWIVKSKYDLQILTQLTAKFLVIRTRENRYVVHDLIRNLCLSKINDLDRQELHKQAVALLWSSATNSLLALRELSYHALNAQAINEAQQALTAFVTVVAEQGNWGMVLDATKQLSQIPSASGWQVANYYRARGLRLIDDLTGALQSYRTAQLGEQTRISIAARYEEGSILAMMDDANAAVNIYESLLECEYPDVCVEARLGLALIIDTYSDFDGAIKYLNEAKTISKENSLKRCEAELEQTWGILLLRQSEPQQALEHLISAYQLRSELAQANKENVMLDLIGWINLYQNLIEVETILGNRKGALGAARGFWEFSTLSGNLHLLARATFEFSTAATEGDNEVLDACNLLQKKIEEATSEAPIIFMMGYLVASLWSAGKIEDALETALSFDREETWQEVPLFFYKLPISFEKNNPTFWFRALPNPDGIGCTLILPKDVNLEEFLNKVSFIQKKYPGLKRTFVPLDFLSKELPS